MPISPRTLSLVLILTAAASTSALAGNGTVLTDRSNIATPVTAQNASDRRLSAYELGRSPADAESLEAWVVSLLTGTQVENPECLRSDCGRPQEER